MRHFWENDARTPIRGKISDTVHVDDLYAISVMTPNGNIFKMLVLDNNLDLMRSTLFFPHLVH